ncbi:nucleotide sugar dehydrogenase [Spongisporangium articulatum]|uniref:Nucleotide sugar dehydrogenase n=1 Tax=Spongisporangium articulatum TaxID=3362603 RepID=A0ABW8APX0_9ACTN
MPLDLALIGLGYVGLPVAQEACRAGLSVVGLDISPEVVTGLNAGRSHVDDLDDAAVAAMLEAGFRAERMDDDAAAQALSRAAAVVICVPTPLSESGGPDLTAVLAAAERVATSVREGTLVVLESTTYPGTTDEVVRPVLERDGRVVGRDLFLAFSPERIDPGNREFGFRNTPKVVGGVTEACADRAVALYGQLVDEVVRTRGAREAEMAKLLENTYRHVNIALVNEMARFCHELDIDLWDVISAASTKPFGFQAFKPGPGVGGHCIPIDPNYLSHRVRAALGYPFRFVELAQEINHGMPGYVVRRVADLLNEAAKPLRGSRVLLLGVTYKADVSDQRESPALPIALELLAKGAHVTWHDPFVTHWPLGDEAGAERADRLEEAVAKSDVTVLLQHHRGYDLDAVAHQAPLVLDTRGVMRPSATVERL